MIRDPKLLLRKMDDLASQVNRLKIEIAGVGLFRSAEKMHGVEMEMYSEIKEKTDELG